MRNQVVLGLLKLPDTEADSAVVQTGPLWSRLEVQLDTGLKCVLGPHGRRISSLLDVSICHFKNEKCRFLVQIMRELT